MVYLLGIFLIINVVLGSFPNPSGRMINYPDGNRIDGNDFKPL